MIIDPRFIDVDFALDPHYTRGNLGRRDAHDGLCRAFGDAAAIIPEAQWRDLALEMERDQSGCSQLVTRVYDQGREGSCVANATAQAHEIIQAVQHGKEEVVPLSAINLYKRIGRSAQSGAYVPDGLKELRERGILPLDTPANRARFPHVMPATGFNTPFPSGWEQTAIKFRAVEWLLIRNPAELVSALLTRWPVVVGRQGHSICYCDVVLQGSDLVVRYINSWGSGWGQQGFGFDSPAQWRSSANSGAWALRAATPVEARAA